ncbi:efflux RND transporter periplasmic adaptor subunit [Pedobacter sp. PLR]|uniref:efflux RND transporter periplasmic adaptor subunit n=1 Tax=Pedobacter sp. PLR TaxID=2994465 RepID=UPI002247CE41|nr:efflux RND transporter periplasmic adaptor subunit [Pedobacter sp. PLR]MCX2453989.1 efflux RND transporter periplasmic adaptor subunit [Pedobacter sp. PLR]
MNITRTKLLSYPLLLTALFSACTAAQQQEQQQDLPEFSTLLIEPSGTAVAVEYPAILQGEETVEIRSKVDGYIEKVYVTEGSRVTKGQPLFIIDANSFQQDRNSKQAAVLAAEADLETASIQAERTKALVDKKIVNDFEHTAAKNIVRVKKAALLQAKAILSAAQSNLAFTHIISPINGVVGSLPHKIGSLVSSTSETPLTSIANTAKIYAFFSLSQQQLASFLNKYDGNQATDKFKNMPEVSLILADGSAYPTKGKIETLSGVLNASTGAANFKAVFPNPEGKLWSGSSAVLRIPTQLNNALMVPKSATFELQGKHFVFTIDPENTVHHTAIEVMDAGTEKDFIVNKGLKSGDQIVTEGLDNLKDGMKIKTAKPVKKLSTAAAQL